MIDQARIAELVADFGDEDLGEIIEMFLAEAWEAMDALKLMLTEDGGEDLSAQFHFLKGCARNVGATDFADHCERLETGKETFGPGEYQSLRSEFEAVCEFFSNDGLRRIA